jgi:hypothetical protein
MSDVSETPQEAAKRAEAKECEVVFGGPKMLLLDIDDEQGLQRFEQYKSNLTGFFKIVREEWWISSSGLPHQHAIIHIDRELSAPTRLGLAVCLGSDPLRSMLAYHRLSLDNADPDRLFRPKTAQITDAADNSLFMSSF